MVKVCLSGVAGRMGKTNVKVVVEDRESQLTGAVEKKGVEFIGMDAGEVAGVGKTGVLITDEIERVIENCDVVIDFSTPEAFDRNLEVILKAKKAFVCGTTGLSAEQIEKAKIAGKSIPIIWSPNFSVGVALLNRLVKIGCEVLGKDFDVEILEIHHRMKKDAPSGTAKKLLSTIQSFYTSGNVLYGREGIIGERTDGEIGVFALRGGDVVGEHTVFFLGQGERIELTHKASSRETFSRGALRSAKFILKNGPGFYSIEDVLGLK